MVDRPISILAHGWAGAGKTALGISAFWDWEKKQPIREGRLLLIGREDNDAFGVPEESIKRFMWTPGNPYGFVDALSKYLLSAVRAAEKPGAPEVYVLDGWSEWQALLVWAYEEVRGSSDGFAKWNAAKGMFLQAVQLLHPKLLHAHVITTARSDARDENEEPKYWVPSIQGWAKTNLGNYSDIVTYVESRPGSVLLPNGKTEQGTHHVYHLLTHPAALVKNRWDHNWLKTGQPPLLTNPRFDDILKAVRHAEGG